MATDNIHENLAAAILLIPLSINPADIEGYITTIANGEHSAVDDLEIYGIPVCGIEDNAVGYTDVVGFVFQQLSCDAFVYGLLVELVTNVEDVFHNMKMTYKNIVT